jgi:hypothetical protein
MPSTSRLLAEFFREKNSKMASLRCLMVSLS